MYHTRMKQQVRFCTSADGTRIALATSGQGPPLVRVAIRRTDGGQLEALDRALAER